MKKGMRAGAWRIYLVVGTLTVVGCFLLPGHQAGDRLLKRRFRALYQAKDAGRDRIVAAGQNLLESR
jgi:hypothetical protein